MPPALQDHLRYPEDIFTVQTGDVRQYHINTAAAFYNAGDAWSLSAEPWSGIADRSSPEHVHDQRSGPERVGTDRADVADLPGAADPGQSQPSFNIMEAYVPVSQNDSVQTLAGFIFGNCNYGPDYGHLTVFETPAGDEHRRPRA